VDWSHIRLRDILDEAFHATVTRSDEHVEKTRDIAFIGMDRIFDRLRHGAESSLVKHVVDTITGASARSKVTNISFNESEPSPTVLHSVPDLFEIDSFSRSEVIQSYYSLI
jgi:hypothetical protein